MLVAAATSVLMFAKPLKAEPVHEFLMSCTYGALAGGLVGAATLAFSSHPGDNLNTVARGASLGLYAGILLGAYVVYGVPGGDDEAPGVGVEAGLPQSSSDRLRSSSRTLLATSQMTKREASGATSGTTSGRTFATFGKGVMPKMWVSPVWSRGGVDGFSAAFTVYQF